MRVKTGLTTVEVLFSLMALATFLFAGFQLYGVVLNGTLAARSQSKATNIAYNHLRHIGNAFNMANCSEAAITNTEPAFNDENLPGLKITSMITAPYGCVAKLIRVEVKVDYNIDGSSRQEVQAIYVQK